MGKKRRILTRTTKFAKKYFEFLDKADGTDDDQIDTSGGRGDAFIDTITIADNEDQTATITGVVLGALTTDEVQLSVDGGAFGDDVTVTDNSDGAGIGRISYSFTYGALATPHTPLTVGSHTFAVRVKDAENEALQKSASATVRENKINLVLAEGTFSDDTDQNIDFDASGITLDATPGKKTAGHADDAVLGAGSNIGIRITILKDGVAQNIQDKANGNVATTQTVGPGNFTTTALDITNILDDAVLAETTFVCRVEPVDSEGTVLSDSAIEQTITVAGP